jgi:hypothetical protein
MMLCDKCPLRLLLQNRFKYQSNIFCRSPGLQLVCRRTLSTCRQQMRVMMMMMPCSESNYKPKSLFQKQRA